jgi:Phosphate-selective porin O and P
MIHRSTGRHAWSASLVTSLFMLAAGAGTASAQTQPAGDEQPPPEESQPPAPAQTPPEESQPPAPVQAPPPSDPETTPVVSRPATLFPTMGKTNELVLGENFFLRPGLLLQGWTELLQDRLVQTDGTDGEYQWNTYLRRARVFFAGGVFKKMTFLLLLEAANLGRANTAMDGTTSKGFNTLTFQDAFLSLNIHPAFTVQAGLMLTPFTRNILQSTSTYTTLDVLTTSATFLAQTQTSALRDTGLQLKGQLLEDHFEYRAGVFQGIRQSTLQDGAQGGKNPFRFTGYLQYNFLDPEVGYVFNGSYYGHKRVFGIAAGFDYQKLDGNETDAYWATSATVFASIPLNGDPKSGGDEVAGLVQFLHFDPGTSVMPPPAPGGIAEQNDIAAELGYYNRAFKTSVFGKVELRTHSDEVFEPADLRIFGGGLKYFLAEAAANVTLAYNRIETPNAVEAMFNPVNQLVMQIQLAYY